MALNLRKVSETASKVTVGWDPVPGAVGYRFQSEGNKPRWSHTWDGSRSSAVFAKGAEPFVVEALLAGERGVWTGEVEPPPPSSGMPDRSLAAWLTQPQIAGLPVQTVAIDSWDGNPRAGVLLRVTGAGTVSQSQAGRLCSWRGPFAAVQLDPAARFGFEVPMSSSSGAGRKDLAIFGGLLVNPSGYGVRFSAASKIQWWGGTIRDCGRTGLLVHGNVADCDQLDLAFAISRCGLDAPNSDPHSEKGTGYHGAYLADTGGRITNLKAAFWVTDQPYGAACQIGPALRSSRLWIDARRVTFRAQSQVAGNAAQWWGGVSGNTIEYLYGEGLAGRLSETDGGAGSGNRILVGRYRNVRLSPVCAPGVPCDDLKAV